MQKTPVCPAHWLGRSSNHAAHSKNLAKTAIAFSGGADSSALLLAAVQALGADRVLALHINHGLQAAAADFERRVTDFCAHRRIALVVLQTPITPKKGQSTEDAARIVRYAALAQAAKAQGAGCVWLAQHGDDQVESVLLALTRGAGVAGLAGMAATFERHGVRFERPFLHLSSAEIRTWLDENSVLYVTDPTNADPHYTRNRIRAELLPALQAHFPQYRTTFSRSAAHAASAAAVLSDLAAYDAALCGMPPLITALQTLTKGNLSNSATALSGAERQAQALRYWLRTQHQTTPDASQLLELQKQIAACTTRGHKLRLKIGTGFVVRLGDRLGYEESALHNHSI